MATRWASFRLGEQTLSFLRWTSFAPRQRMGFADMDGEISAVSL
jgi:hypothetical protein